MTSYSINEYLGNNDPDNKLSLKSRCVDVAVIDSEEIIAPREVDAHIISFDAQYITLDKFMSMFYHVDNNTFQMNKTMYKDTEFSFIGRTINTNEFHLANSIIRLYGLDLGVELDCIYPCSLIDITRQVLYYRSLTNMCSVKCSLTFSEIVETIANQNESESGDWTTVFGKPGDEDGGVAVPVHHQCVINCRFYNANPAVRDIIVKFRYNVEFAGEHIVTNILTQVRP